MATFLDPTKHRTPYGEYPSVSTEGWPEPGWVARPRDSIGEAILAYAKKWKGHPDFPASPWDDRHGKIFLRDLDKPEPTDLSEERRMIEPKHEARPMADVIPLDDHRPPHSARMAATDPLAVALAALAALAALPRTAGLATRTRALIEAGAADVFVDCYIAAWVDSARTDVDANRYLHFSLADYLGGVR